MAGQGFDYVPWFPGISSVASAEPEEANLDPIERAQQWGYGYFTRAAEPTPDPSWYDDPNEASMLRMSPSEREAYLSALAGPRTADSPVVPGLPGGCQGWAAAEINEITPQQVIADEIYSDPRFTELQAAIASIASGIAASPAYAALNKAWSACMGAADLDYASPDEAEARFSARFQEEALPRPAEQEALAQEEISTAVADQRCRRETGYAEAYEQATWNLEQQVLDRYREDVTALTSLVAQQTRS